MKKILIVFAGLAVVAVIALYLLVGNLDKIIKGAIEGAGSELLGVPVTVAYVELDLKSGTGRISGITVANPAGYQAVNAFQMDMIRLGLDLGSLKKQPIVIKELNIQSPTVDLEVNDQGGSNMQTLIDNIKKNSAKTDEKAAEEQPSQEETGSKEPVKLSFTKLAITGATVNGVVAGQKLTQVVLPDIVRENVGGSKGLTPAQVGGVIIGDIAAQSLQAVVEKKLSEKVEEAAQGLFEDLKKKLAQ
ncbi:MAG: AsmA family protein [Desulfofustis sp.]|nr:AsmA family protein [Desulfofustis sp.]NNK58285.1 AsmA family protein [Desulfofustis sp.]